MDGNLFPHLPVIRPDMSQHGAQYQDGNWLVRNWHGFMQSREVGQRNWCFQIYGFRDTDCNVATWDDQGQPASCLVPIDQKDRITILGRKYGRAHWSH